MKVQSDRSIETVMSEFLKQSEKALLPMEVIPDRLHSPSVLLLNVLRLLQDSKQLLGMVDILFVGHVTLVMPEQ